MAFMAWLSELGVRSFTGRKTGGRGAPFGPGAVIMLRV
jgi:hypothetical protein